MPLTLAGRNDLAAKQVRPAAVNMANEMLHCRLGVWEPIASLTDNLNTTASCEVPPVIRTVS